MKRQHTRLTATEQEVMRLRTDGRDLSTSSKRRAAQQAGEDMDAAIESEVRRGCDCCDRGGRYNGFASDGPLRFVCPKKCPCHD